MTLKKQAVGAAFWSGTDVLLRQSIQFIVTVVLARLISPADFGTVAALGLFMGLANVLMDGGFSIALMRDLQASHTDESTVFWLNVGAAVLLALLLTAAAPRIATYFGMPKLVTLTPAFCVTIVLSSLSSVQTTLVAKHLQFRRLALVNTTASLASGALAIVLALAGYGVWALAGRAVVLAAATTAMLWIVQQWRPLWTFNRASMHKLFSFGGYHLAASLLDMFHGRLYTLILGRWFGARELGYYGNADGTQQLPSQFLSGLLSRAALPMLARAAHEPSTLRRGMQLALRGTMLVNAPLMLGMAATSDLLVQTLFGTSWLPAAPILAILSFAGILYPVHAFNVQVLLACGHSDLVFRIGIMKAVTGILLLLAAAPFGMVGIAWSQVAMSILALFINAHYTAKHIGYGLSKQARDFLPPLIVATGMYVSVLVVGHLWAGSQPSIVRLAVLVSLGLILYGSTTFLFGLNALHDVLLLFRRTPTPTSRGREAT